MAPGIAVTDDCGLPVEFGADGRVAPADREQRAGSARFASPSQRQFSASRPNGKAGTGSLARSRQVQVGVTLRTARRRGVPNSERI